MASSFKGVLMGMGNPLLDISATAPPSLLEKYSLKNGDAILAEEKHMPIYNELVSDYDVNYIAGGATQNSIRVAQWMLTAAGKEGATVFMGCVGKDQFGEQLAECAKKDGVLTHYMVDESTPTGTCAVLIVEKERSMVTNLQAANNFKPSHLETDLAKSIYETVDYYYIAGFFLTVSVPSLVIVAEHALANNKTFCLNLSAPFIIDFFGDQVATALEYADFVFCNEAEAEAYGKKAGWGSDLQEVALKLSATPKKNTARDRVVIFTQGSKSTIVATKGTVTEYAVEPLPAEQLVDTNGAGDAFVGGFLSQLVQGKSLEEAVKAGHYAGRFIIQQSGTTLDKPCEYQG